MCNLIEQVHMLAEILTVTLQCGGNLTANQIEFAENLKTALRRAAEVVTQRPFVNHLEEYGNSTDFFTKMFSPGGMVHRNSSSYHHGGVNNASLHDGIHPTEIPPGLKLHRLEIIKVVVLIVVISIILLSTCRMVFQLFVKFRPEKSP